MISLVGFVLGLSLCRMPASIGTSRMEGTLVVSVVVVVVVAFVAVVAVLVVEEVVTYCLLSDGALIQVLSCSGVFAEEI